jgi:hypothetical protein
MPFDTLRAAVKFVMEEMNENERADAWINTEAGTLKDLAQIEDFYRIIALGDDTP